MTVFFKPSHYWLVKLSGPLTFLFCHIYWLSINHKLDRFSIENDQFGPHWLRYGIIDITDINEKCSNTNHEINNWCYIQHSMQLASYGNVYIPYLTNHLKWCFASSALSLLELTLASETESTSCFTVLHPGGRSITMLWYAFTESLTKTAFEKNCFAAFKKNLSSPGSKLLLDWNNLSDQAKTF